MLRIFSFKLARRLSPQFVRPFAVDTDTKSEITSASSEDKSLRNDMPIEIENPFKKEKEQCILCKLRLDPDFKNIKLLSQFVSPYTGQIYGRHITGLCRKKQADVEREINKARSAGFMAAAIKELVFMRDPKLFDPDRPYRPHKY